MSIARFSIVSNIPCVIARVDDGQTVGRLKTGVRPTSLEGVLTYKAIVDHEVTEASCRNAGGPRLAPDPESISRLLCHHEG